jgi:hypothetical protein
MTEFQYGPVELVLAAIDGDTPDPGVIEAILELDQAGTVRVLDLVYVTRTLEGDIDILEVDQAGITFAEIDLPAKGLASEDDVHSFGDRLAPGTSAILLVVELLWARHLASRLAEANGYVVDAIRIPAPVVNAVAAEAIAAS